MISSGFDLLFSLDLVGLIGVFWFYFLFELPRYTLSTIAVAKPVFSPKQLARFAATLYSPPET